MSFQHPLFIINVLNPGAFSGSGSVITLELTDEDAAMRVASKIASETGRSVTVRKEDMQVIGRIKGADRPLTEATAA